MGQKDTEQFKKGDFVVIEGDKYLITEIDNQHVILSLNGRECIFDIGILRKAHLDKDTKDNDASKNEIIDKACEWLSEHFDDRWYWGRDNEGDFIDFETFLNDFKKAMTEQK